MLSQIQLESQSYDELKELVRGSGLDLPKHASKEDLVDLMVEHYRVRQLELAQKNEQGELNKNTTNTGAVSANTGKGRYAGFDTRQEYINHMLTPVLCIVTPQSPEFSRQATPTCAISVGNDLIVNREFAFIADGQTVTAIPRLALNRIKEMKLLMRGSRNLNKNEMKSNLQGSGFGARFRVYELNEEEIADYRASKGKKDQAAQPVGL